MQIISGRNRSYRTALLASSVALLWSTYAVLTTRDELFVILFAFMSVQVVALALIGRVAPGTPLRALIFLLTTTALLWALASAIVVTLGAWSGYANHGFLGWERDGYIETETTGRFGVTVIDLAFTALILTMQMLTFRVLWLGRATKETEKQVPEADSP